MFREFAAENARRRNQANRDARHAWLTVAMWASTVSKKKVPALERYMIRGEPAPDKRGAKLRAAMEILSAQLGIPLRPHTKD